MSARSIRVLRPILSGLAGTAVMTMTTRLEAVARKRSRQPVDYDDSLIPIKVLESLLSMDISDDAAERLGNRVIHFGYGSTAGLVRAAVDDRVRHPAVAFFVITWGAEIVTLPLLGVAPPVWRWKPDVLATSMVQHAIYSFVTDAVYRGLGQDE